MSDSLSIGSVSVTGDQAMVGKQEIQGGVNKIVQGPQAVTPEAVFKTLTEALPADKQAEYEEKVFGPLKAELQALSAVPVLEAESQRQSFLDRAAAIVEPLRPYAGSLTQAALVFTEVGLSAIVPGGWLIAGALAAIRKLSTSPAPAAAPAADPPAV